MTIVAIGAPITEAERAAIPASIREDPNIPIPIEFPMYVKIPPTEAPRTKAGENTPPKKPILRQTTVTNNLSNKIKIKKFLDKKTGWITINSDNPFVNGWYLEISKKGSVGADHLF